MYRPSDYTVSEDAGIERKQIAHFLAGEGVGNPIRTPDTLYTLFFPLNTIMAT
jgi:hypothetical protein